MLAFGFFLQVPDVLCRGGLSLFSGLDDIHVYGSSLHCDLEYRSLETTPDARCAMRNKDRALSYPSTQYSIDTIFAVNFSVRLLSLLRLPTCLVL